MPNPQRKKPAKPRATYPLTAHPNGQWCKKIRGKIYFFGVWSDPDAALANYLRVAADLHAGRPPTNISSPELTVKELGNEFLAYQLERVSSRQIGARWFEDCRRVVRQFAKCVGASRAVTSLAASDFQKYRRILGTGGLAGKKPLGVHALTRTITVVRGLFKWAVEMGLIEREPRWGKALVKPSAADLRRSRAATERENGKRLVAASEIRSFLESANLPLKAAILLGMNGGFGNTDCSALPASAVNFKWRLIDFERPKTGVRRIVPLWPETVSALKAVLADRKPSRDVGEGPLFLTESGLPLIRQILRSEEAHGVQEVTYIDRLGDWFDHLLLEKQLKRRGVGFYSLRHTFRTWADATNDQHAIHIIMGHAIPGMSGIYVEEVGQDRLRRVVNHVRGKLWPRRSDAGRGKPKPNSNR